MEGLPLIDVYRQLLAALIIQAGGELHIQDRAINSVGAGMDIVQTVDPETGDVLLHFAKVEQEA